MFDIKKPSKTKFDLTIHILSKSKTGEEYKLCLHTEKDSGARNNILLKYQDRIEKGDIVHDKILKAIKEDFGIEKIIDIEFIETPAPDPDEFDTDNFEYDIYLVVDYNKDYERKIGDVYSSWIELVE